MLLLYLNFGWYHGYEINKAVLSKNIVQYISKHKVAGEAQIGKTQCTSTREWINRQRYIHPTVCHLAIRRNKTLFREKYKQITKMVIAIIMLVSSINCRELPDKGARKPSGRVKIIYTA